MKRLISIILYLYATNLIAQTWAVSQVPGTTGTCIGCEVGNPSFSVDADPDTYSLFSLTVTTPDAAVFQELIFDGPGSNTYVGVLVEADNLVEIVPEILAGLTLTTYQGATPNATRTGADVNIAQFGVGNRYLLEYEEMSAFDRIEVRLSTSLIPSALNTLRVYGAYHSNGPLPVELVELTINHGQNDQVILKWVTASELNNDFFMVQRSQDGVNYHDLAFIPGQGTTSSITYYEYLDGQPDPGHNYYRLAQYDYDGEVNFTHGIHLYMPFGIEVYPNPVSSTAKISIDSYGPVYVQVQDLSSKVYYRKITQQSQGLISIEVDFDSLNLSKGIYLIVVKSKVIDKVIRVKLQ